MNANAVRREDLFRYRLRSTQDRVARTVDWLMAQLAGCTRPYVAFSGGKDSLVALALTARAARALGRTDLVAIWSDDELEYPGQPEYIRQTAAAVGVPLVVTLGWTTHAGWFLPWRMPPFWRPVPGDALAIGTRLERWASRNGYDAVVLGLRGEESARRRTYLAACGRAFRTRAGILQLSPLAGWTVDDVWAVIAGEGLSYSPVYDRLAAIGVPREQQRVGPLPLARGWTLRTGWPDLYRRLVQRYGPRWPDA